MGASEMPVATLFTAEQFALWFEAQVGKPYVLGANGPEAFDCSGLVLAGMRNSGAWVHSDDTAAGIYNCTVAATGSVKVGDLVFLRNNPARSNGIGHVATIVRPLSNGDWEIIEARGHAFGVVKTTLSYWKTRKYYTGVRRIPSFHLAATPTPTPTPATDTAFWATTYNCEDPRFGGQKDDDAALLKAASASVYLLVEAPEVVRTNARKRLAGGLKRWLVWTRGDGFAQAILFDSTKWAHTSSKGVTFGPTSYHGGVIAVLTRKDTGQKVQFGALHLPPTNVASEADRRKWLAKFVGALDKSLPTVIGGDFNSKSSGDWLKAYGFTPTTVGPTTDGGNTLDHVATLNAILGEAQIYNPGKASDHRAVRAHVTVHAVPTN